MFLILAFLIGGVAGLRAMTAPAAVSWAAGVGWIKLTGTPLAFMGATWAAWMFTVLAVAELISDQLPKTPSRKVPVQFAGRIVAGGLCGAAISFAGGMLIAGIVLGIVGAVAGTYGGAAGRGVLAAYFKKDMPAAFIDDGVAVVGAGLIVMAFV